MRPVIKLRPEYGCWPLWWEAGHEPDNIDPAELPLSQALVTDLVRWADVYEATLNQEYPPDSAFSSPEIEAEFHREGERLWLWLREELAGEYEVVYYRNGVEEI